MVEIEVVDCMNDIINKVVQKEYRRQYRLKNKEKIREQQKGYKLKNKEKISEKQKEYSQSENGRKSSRITVWKRRGIITNDFDQLYNHYLKTSFCDFCKVKLTYGKKITATTKCCDHDHSITDRPNFRNILCHSCNTKRR